MPDANPGWREQAPPGTSLLAGLTLEQVQAVTHGAGPLLLIAGPGAGETRTPTHRIAYLLETGRARPDQVLAVTFSVRAAGELRDPMLSPGDQLSQLLHKSLGPRHEPRRVLARSR